MSEYNYVGKNITRSDGADKARGRFNYLADENSALCAVVLMSPHAHARVISIDVSRAVAAGALVLTFEDAPETKYNSGEWFPGQNDFPDETVLTGTPRHVGDRIALVAARTEREARAACELINVEYEILTPTVDPLSASERHEGKLGFGDVDAAFARAANIVSHTISTQKIHHAAMETHAVMARPSSDGVLEVHTPCQILFGVQHKAALVTGLPLSKIRVIKTHMGGTFGGKQEVVFETLCAWAAQKLGKPILINTNREETVISTRTRSACIGKVETALDSDGKIIARRFDVTADAGAYLSGTKKVMMAMGKKTSRLYRIPAVSYEGRAVITNTTPAGACRGYGSPQIHTITEIHTDLLCRQMGFDPVEFRLKNLVHPHDEDPSGASPLGNARAIDCLERGVREFGWNSRKTHAQNGRFRHGAGFACCTHGNGYYGTIYHDFVSMSLRIMEDGSAVLRTALHELGNGTIHAVAQIVAEVTGIPPEKITVTEGDSLFSGYDVGCQASRVIFVCGECARLCAEKAVALLCSEVEKLKDAPAVLENGVLKVAGQDLTIADAVTELERKCRITIDVTVEHRPMHNPGSYAAHFADVTVDILTGRVRVNDYLAVHDIGQAINRNFVEGQIYGGVQMGLGMALMEELHFDKNGNPLARNFDKYHMFNAPEMPDVKVLLIEEGETGGPFGAKSIGEISTVPVAAAVVNAVNRALGTSICDLPLTPAKCIAALIS